MQEAKMIEFTKSGLTGVMILFSWKLLTAGKRKYKQIKAVSELTGKGNEKTGTLQLEFG